MSAGLSTMYQNLLGRTPSQDELAGWQGTGLSGQALYDAFSGAAQQELAGRPQANLGNLANNVNANYQQLLGRAPSEQERTAWTGSGLTPEQLYQQMSQAAQTEQQARGFTPTMPTAPTGPSAGVTDFIGTPTNQGGLGGLGGTDTGGGTPTPMPNPGNLPTANDMLFRGPGASDPNASDDVMDNVAAVFAADSPLMQQAETRGLAMANRRGLLNSSMGVQAAQDAILDVAVPIGSQNASQGFQRNLSYQDYTQRSDMLDRELGSRRDLLEMELGSRESIAGLDRDLRLELQSLDNSFRERLAGLELNSQERRAAAQSFEGVLRLYQNTLVNINSNQEIPADAREDMITAARDRLNSEIELMESLYGVSVVF